MKINFDHMRMQTTCSLNRLCALLGNLIDYLPEAEQIDELVQAYDEVAAYVGTLNCISHDGEDLVSDLSGIINVRLLGEVFPLDRLSDERTALSRALTDDAVV